MSYYDGLLMAIATALLAGGSAMSTLIMYEILFRKPPTEPTRSPTIASVVVGVGWLLSVALIY